MFSFVLEMGFNCFFVSRNIVFSAFVTSVSNIILLAVFHIKNTFVFILLDPHFKHLFVTTLLLLMYWLVTTLLLLLLLLLMHHE